MDELRQQTKQRLGRFSGRTRDIRGRPYLHFEDYLRWRGRKAKGDLESGLRHGLLLSSWKQWVADNGGAGTATLEDVKVDRFNCYLESYQYRPCRDEDEVASEQRRRKSLLDSLRGWKPGSRSYDRYYRRISSWSEMAGNFLCDLYSLRQASDAIIQRYFDGHQAPFPASASGFARLVECIEELVQGFNEDFGYTREQEVGPAPGSLDGAKPPNFIDIAILQEAVVPAAMQHTTFLVDMAKAEALDAIGETRQACEVMERHV